MTRRRAANILLLVVGLVLLGVQLVELYYSITHYPFPYNATTFWAINQFALIILIYMLSTKLILLMSNIISVLDFLLLLFNEIFTPYVLLPIGKAYTNTVTSEHSVVPFSYDGAVSSYRLLLIVVACILLLLWLKYVIIIKHNISESGGD